MNTRSSAQKRNGSGPIGLDEVALDELLSPVRHIQLGSFDSPSRNTRSSAQKRRGDDFATTETSDEEATIRYPNRKSRKRMNEDELLLILVERLTCLPSCQNKLRIESAKLLTTIEPPGIMVPPEYHQDEFYINPPMI
jgi:hypothetical protein